MNDWRDDVPWLLGLFIVAFLVVDFIVKGILR